MLRVYPVCIVCGTETEEFIAIVSSSSQIRLLYVVCLSGKVCLGAFDSSKVRISCHYPHLLKGCDMEDISKSQIETVDFHLKCISREEWNINFYRL